MNHPTDQMRAGHRRSEDVPSGVHPGHTTIVHVHPSVLSGRGGQILLVLSGTVGVCATVYFLAQAVDGILRILIAASPSVGGVSVALGRKK